MRHAAGKDRGRVYFLIRNERVFIISFFLPDKSRMCVLRSFGKLAEWESKTILI